jgi:D-glycero-alpha-D-manno-heptose-7-phosphate kinase
MIITQTPLRISFVGGGTDIPEFYTKHGGAVVSTAIDKYIFAIVKERFDDMIYLNYSKKEIVESRDAIEHELMRESMKKAGVLNGVEITTLSDIPSEGSGLGSSSSVTVALLQALYLYNGMIVDAERLAKEAANIEIDILDEPIGKQDQYIAAYGGLKQFEFYKDGSVKVTPIILKESEQKYLDACLMLFYTGTTRKANTILAEQKSQIVNTEDILCKMKDQTYELLEHFKAGDIDYLGTVLDQAWAYKKQLAGGISSPGIDDMYTTAREAGALGGKIAGAGGGGFLMLYVPLDKQSRVRSALGQYKEFHFHLERDGSKSIFNIRR